MKYKHLFWDFDGTLYDTYPQILNAMLQALNLLYTKDEFLRLADTL